MKNFIYITNKFKFYDGIGIPVFSDVWNHFINYIQLIYMKKRKLPSECLNRENRKEKLVVSLTTFPKRIHTVEVAIKSIMCQTVKPDKIILWLSKEQFGEMIPDNLRFYVEKGLTVRFCEDDLKSHKKYFYILKEQKKELIVTIDDDLIYPENLLESLLIKHKDYPNAVVCYRGREMFLDDEKKVAEYWRWQIVTEEGVERPSYLIMPSTGAGTLYPPDAVNDKVFDVDILKKYAFSTDDIWLKFMELLNLTPVIKTHKNVRYLSEIKTKEDERLLNINIVQGKNDEVVKNLSKLFPEALQKIKEIGEGV
ncbi:hypothetical protein AALC25_03150 [Lachnospiraceae bacterium 29-84]